MAKRMDFSESSSLHSHRHPADKWDGRGRPSLPLRESNLLGHSTQTRWFAEFWGLNLMRGTDHGRCSRRG
jgi:hypothetical protein